MRTVSSFSDLVTTKEATVGGFSWQAKEKLKRADDFFRHADYFSSKAKTIKSVGDIKSDPNLFEFVIASCMLSKKSLTHLSPETQDKIISQLIDFTNLSNPDYLKSLERRYFLTSGDSLGGTMRNVVGKFAQEKLSNLIFKKLQDNKKNPQIIYSSAKKITGIRWDGRMVIFDKKPNFIGKSIDLIVIKGRSAEIADLEKPADYLCCGELKGGIDPAGADEHWKTAKTALERIHTAFTSKSFTPPKLVFLGAAIEAAMSQEIFELISSGWLSGAANINYEDQLNEVIEIITG